MTTIFRYLFVIALAAAIVGCQGDSSEESSQQPSQSQQSGPLSQMQQQVPDVEITDEEAKIFAQAAMQAQQLQMQSQKKMIGAIQDEGLDIKTYQTIARATQKGPAPDSISDGDMDKFNSAQDSIKQIQNKIQSKIQEIVKESGMEMERFRNISRAARQDTQLQKKIQQQMQKQVGQRMQQQAPQSSN